MANSKFKALVDLVHLMVGVVQGYQEAKKDGKLDVSDAQLLFKLLPQLQLVLSELGQIPASFEHISAADGLALAQDIAEELAISDEHAKLVINEALKTAAQVITLVQAITKK